MKIFGYSVEECLTFFMLIVIGYFIAKMFSQKCNGFSVGAPIDCESMNPVNCHMHLRHGCELKDNKCVNKNAPAGKKENDSECNSDLDCKSGYCNGSDKCQGCLNDPNYKLNPLDCTKCLDKKFKAPHCTSCSNSLHHYPDCTECKERQYKYPKCTDLKDCNELNSAYCALNQFCKFNQANKQCQSKFKKKELGDTCNENNECQTGVCHSEDLMLPYKCMNCSNVNKLSCRMRPGLDGHSDVCKVNGDKCIYRHCSVQMGGNQVDSCDPLSEANCTSSRNRNNELCYFNNGQCTNQSANGEIYKCKP